MSLIRSRLAVLLMGTLRKRVKGKGGSVSFPCSAQAEALTSWRATSNEKRGRWITTSFNVTGRCSGGGRSGGCMGGRGYQKDRGGILMSSRKVLSVEERKHLLASSLSLIEPMGERLSKNMTQFARRSKPDGSFVLVEGYSLQYVIDLSMPVDNVSPFDAVIGTPWPLHGREDLLWTWSTAVSLLWVDWRSEVGVCCKLCRPDESVWSELAIHSTGSSLSSCVCCEATWQLGILFEDEQRFVLLSKGERSVGGKK